MKTYSRVSFLRALLGLLCAAAFPAVASAAEIGAPQPAQPLSTPAPKYPYLPRRAEATAEITVAFTISVRGAVTGARVEKSSNPDFNDACLAAIRRWRFAPARQDGRPVETRARQTFIFSLHDQPPAGSKAPLAAKQKPR